MSTSIFGDAAPAIQPRSITKRTSDKKTPTARLTSMPCPGRTRLAQQQKTRPAKNVHSKTTNNEEEARDGGWREAKTGVFVGGRQIFGELKKQWWPIVEVSILFAAASTVSAWAAA